MHAALDPQSKHRVIHLLNREGFNASDAVSSGNAVVMQW